MGAARWGWVVLGTLWSGAASAESFTYAPDDLGPLAVCARPLPDGGVGALSREEVAAACADATSTRGFAALEQAHAALLKAGPRTQGEAGLVGELPALGVPLSADALVTQLAGLLQQRMEHAVIQSFVAQTARQVCAHPERARWVPRFCAVAAVLADVGDAAPWLIVRRALERDLRALPAHAAQALAAAEVPLEALPPALDADALDALEVQWDPGHRRLAARGRLGRRAYARLSEACADPAWRAAVEALQAAAAARDEVTLGEAFALELAADLLEGDSPLPRLLRVMDPAEHGYACARADGTCARRLAVLSMAGQYLVRVLGTLHFTRTPIGREGMVDALQVVLTRAVKTGPLAEVEDASIRRVAEGLQALVRAADASGAPDPAPGAERGARVVQGTFDLARELLEGVARQPSLRPELAAEARRLRGALAAAEEVAVALLEGPRFDQAVLSVVLLVRRTLPEALPGPALQVLTFGTNLASAQDADSVQSVLESTVASAGAWRLKRRPGVHVSVTALPGVAGGFERAILSQGEGAPAVYLFAPVGVELSLLGSEGFGLGLFASVVDVGQLLSLPLDPKTDAERLERAEVRVEQVFSPGLYLKVGLGDTPLVVGGGASLAPGLRDVVAGAPVEGATVVRGVAFVAVDVTLYPF